MRYFSVFSGVGGFELGIKNAYVDSDSGREERRGEDNTERNAESRKRLQSLQEESNRIPEGRNGEYNHRSSDKGQPHCVGFSEIDKYASAVLRYRFPNTTNYGDITKIDWSAVPDFDMLVGGSPCQDLSVAGKQKGLVGERSGLFHEYVKALEIKKPSHFIWENVKGALSSNGGRDFATILNAFSEAGYSLTWQVLNAKDFGVPQNRERVFVVGTRDGSPREVFFERGDAKKDSIEHVAAGVNNPSRGYEKRKDGNASSLRAGESGTKNIIQINNPRHSNDRVYSDDGISPTLNTMQGGLRQPFVSRAVLTPGRIEKRQQGRRMKEDGEPAFTVNTQDIHGVYNGERIRRLTPRECERLMSWPDDWTRWKWGEFGNKGFSAREEVSDSQRYKMCGNGVVSKVVTAVVRAHFL